MKFLLATCLSLALLPACHSAPPVPEGAAVRILEGHFHTRYCGHYRFGTQWYFIEKHRHGVDCGHEQVDGEWVLPLE